MLNFSRFCNKVSDMTGRPISFILAFFVVAVWCITGPLFHYCDTWQLVINTLSSISTFMMVFLIQNTQNRESKAMQLKLDELIRSMEGAHNALLNLEDLSSEEIDAVQAHYVNIARGARLDLKQGRSDTGVAEAPIHAPAKLCVVRDIEPLGHIPAKLDLAKVIGDSTDRAVEQDDKVVDISASLAARKIIEECEKRLTQ